MRHLNLEDVAYVTEEIASKMQRTVVYTNDVLLNITGASIGRVATFEEADVKANVNQHVCIIRTKPEKLYHRYLMHFIAQPLFQAYINSTQHGGTRQALTFDKIRSFQIPLPPLEEQCRIAVILDRADAVRRKRQEAIRLTEELLRSAFLEMFGDPATNPKGWDVKPLAAVADILTGYPFKSQEYVNAESGIRLCRGANVLPDSLNWEDVCYWRFDEAEQFEKFKLQENDVVVALDRPWISSGFKIAIVTPQDLPALLVQRVAMIRAKKTQLQHYLYFSLRHPAFEMHCHPTETTIPHISPNDLKTYPVPIPTFAIIERFNLAVLKYMESKHKLIQQNQQMEILFHSLLQQAFQGGLKLA